MPHGAWVGFAPRGVDRFRARHQLATRQGARPSRRLHDPLPLCTPAGRRRFCRAGHLGASPARPAPCLRSQPTGAPTLVTISVRLTPDSTPIRPQSAPARQPPVPCRATPAEPDVPRRDRRPERSSVPAPEERSREGFQNWTVYVSITRVAPSKIVIPLPRHVRPHRRFVAQAARCRAQQPRRRGTSHDASYTRHFRSAVAKVDDPDRFAVALIGCLALSACAERPPTRRLARSRPRSP